MKRIIQAVVVAALFTSTQAKAEDAPIVLPAQWTYGDSEPAVESAMRAPVSAFPGSAREDPIVVESMSTYADSFTGERSAQAGSASDPALSQ